MADNIVTIRNLYDAFAKGDIQAVLVGLAPNVEWTEAEGFLYGGTFIGPDAVLENVFMKLGAEWDGWAAVPNEFAANNKTVVAIGDYSGTFKATGKDVKVPFVHVWKLRDGRVTSFRQHTDTAVVQRALQ